MNIIGDSLKAVTYQQSSEFDGLIAKKLVKQFEYLGVARIQHFLNSEVKMNDAIPEYSLVPEGLLTEANIPAILSAKAYDAIICIFT